MNNVMCNITEIECGEALALYIFKILTQKKDSLSRSRRHPAKTRWEPSEAVGLLLKAFRIVVNVGINLNLNTWSKGMNGLLIMTLFYSFLITTIYKTSLVAHLTQPTYSEPLNSLEELVNSDYGWGIVNNGAADYDLYANSEEEIYKKIFKSLQFCKSALACMSRTKDEKFAFLSWSSYLKDLTLGHYVDLNRQPLLVQAREVYNTPSPEAWVLPPSSPFKHHFDTEFLRVVQTAFYILGIGLLLSFLLFVVEAGFQTKQLPRTSPRSRFDLNVN